MNLCSLWYISKCLFRSYFMWKPFLRSGFSKIITIGEIALNFYDFFFFSFFSWLDESNVYGFILLTNLLESVSFDSVDGSSSYFPPITGSIWILHQCPHSHYSLHCQISHNCQNMFSHQERLVLSLLGKHFLYSQEFFFITWQGLFPSFTCWNNLHFDWKLTLLL